MRFAPLLLVCLDRCRPVRRWPLWLAVLLLASPGEASLHAQMRTPPAEPAPGAPLQRSLAGAVASDGVDMLKLPAPMAWRTPDRQFGPPRLSSCWAKPDATGPATLTLLFAGTLREAAWLRLVPALPATHRAGTASAASDDGNLQCLNAAHIGVGLAGEWEATTIVTVRYSPGARVLLEAPTGRIREVYVPSGAVPLACRLSVRGGEYDMACREDERNQGIRP